MHIPGEPIKFVSVPVWKCEKCGYEFPSKPQDIIKNGHYTKPAVCPPPNGCNSPRWDRPKKMKV